MTVAPEMFDVQHGIGALKLVDKSLSPTAMEAGSMSTSTDTIRTLHTRQPSPSPSPPDSPSLSASGSSVSSFPSVSSSFFFSSAAASPPHVPPLPLEGEGQLIIPELEEEGRGKAVTRLLILGPRAAAAAAALCVDNPSGWAVEEDGLSMLRAESAWRDDDAHDKSKSSGTLELVSLDEDVHQLSLPITTHQIITPFRAIGALLAPPVLSSPDREKEEKLLRGMVEGVGVPIYKALVVVLPRDRISSLTRRRLRTHPCTANPVSGKYKAGRKPYHTRAGALVRTTTPF
ncbi:hypothetical protein B0H13DRAFT_2336745 [Mycena leptocephala]|nr:hypothetical protein B0H13DRAFT_2336745 [Mycena leptocephala]